MVFEVLVNRRPIMSHLMNTYARLPVTFSHGGGNRLTDVNARPISTRSPGSRWNTLGHNHLALVRAIAEQAGRLLHVESLRDQ